jgi:hypothetical protein
MIEQMTVMELPSWLMNVSPDTINQEPLPLHGILKDSLYYPGAGSDGKPVKWLAGNVYSFVYTDYGVSRSHFLSDLNDGRRGFNGYQILAQRDVTMKELIPNGWTPMFPDSGHHGSNGWRQNPIQPFGIWTVMERLPELSLEHGPERFSLLYLCSEGVAAYQALYNSNRVKPKVLFLIQHGFGGNWTDFHDPSEIFAQSVRANPAGMPDYLVGRYKSRLKGSIQGESHWPEDYPAPTLHYFWGGYGFGVWRHQ